MTIIRIFGGVLSAVFALLFAAAAATGFWDEFALRRRAAMDGHLIHFQLIEVGGLTLEGWQIHAFYAALTLAALGFSLLAFLCFHSTGNGNDA